jgi:arginyl-tRNA--protein-N-Asp/Glu arginylyltransferase
MFTNCHYPSHLSPKELDRYLARGWFRMGQTIFTCFFLDIEEGIFPTIWLRQDLRGYHFKKSHRRLMRKVARNFRVAVGPIELTEEKDELFHLHKVRFEGPVSPSLADSLLDGAPRSIYDTWEVTVYDGDKLIAASYFDRGEESIASIKGMFHPDYASYSLGFYTMLKEMEYARDQGYHFFYPGYFVVDYSKFDYKLRIGQLDYYDSLEDQWLPMAEYRKEQLAAVILKQKMRSLEEELNELDIYNELLFFPSPSVFMQTDTDEKIRSPLALWCPKRSPLEPPLLVDYELATSTYRVYKIGLKLYCWLETSSLDEVVEVVNFRKAPKV